MIAWYPLSPTMYTTIKEARKNNTAHALGVKLMYLAPLPDAKPAREANYSVRKMRESHA